MAVWQLLALAYLILTVLVFGWFASIWNDERDNRRQVEEDRHFRDVDYDPEVLRWAARIALAAPLWPVLLLWVAGRGFGTMLGRLSVDAKGDGDG